MPKYSPFFTFVHFYRNEERRNGRNLTLDEAKEEAQDIWAEMPSSSKMAFTQMAEDQTFQARKREPERQLRKCRPSNFRAKMRSFIEVLLSKIEDVRKHQFYFMSAYRESHTRFPSEISVLRFSIEQGADHFLHFLLNPEVSPARYSQYEGVMCEPITVIPIEGTNNSKVNLGEVLDAIHQFSMGTVFTKCTEIEAAISCFTKLQQEAPNSSREIIPLDGSELILMLWERSKDGPKAQLLDVHNACSAQTGLDHLACRYHKACNQTPVCTLWKPYVLAYALSQLLAEPYDAPRTEGYHKSNRRWAQPGTYFSGKKNYEKWVFKKDTTGWDSPASSSASSWPTAGATGETQWGAPNDAGWRI